MCRLRLKCRFCYNLNMNKNTYFSRISGFTLIELLVVVLIIGILAAIALPRYEKAIAEAKVAKVLPWFKNIKEGRDLYLMNGGRDNCMDLGRYMAALGIEARTRCSGTNVDGLCENENGWCDSTLYIDDKTTIFNVTGHARYSYKKNKGQATSDFDILLLTYIRGYTSDEKTGDLFCRPNTEWGDSMCQQLASSLTTVKCDYSAKTCYRMNL